MKWWSVHTHMESFVKQTNCQFLFLDIYISIGQAYILVVVEKYI